MLNSPFEALKLKTYLENLVKTPTLENAASLLAQIRSKKNENFQFVQDVFLTTLLQLMDESNGLEKNEIKTVLIQCIILILKGSRLKKELPYRTILMVLLKQIYDFHSNSYNSQLSEELKTEILDCIEVASSHLDCDAVEAFIIEDSKILISQCIFVCKEAIVKEKYLKTRKCAIEALMSLMQLHEKSDFNDLVLRDQISQIVFLVLPQISAVLIKVCTEETIKGSALVQAATKALGRFLCLIFEDYEKKSSLEVTNEDFKRLVIRKEASEDDSNVLKPQNQSKADYIMNLKRSNEWLRAASRKLSPAIERLKCLRGSDHAKVREELAKLSWNLLQKCLPNIRPFMPFLLENLILFSDDSDEGIRKFSRESLKKLSEVLPELNQEVCEIFTAHLTVMPRILMTGDEGEQISGFTLLNSLILTSWSLLENQILLKTFLNLLLNCCELDFSNDLLFFENLATNSLDDQFYQLTTPWKNFKNLKSEAVVRKFKEICENVGKSEIAELCLNFLLDDMNSVEHLVLLIQIIQISKFLSDENISSVVEEFLSETYWTMQIRASARKTQTVTNEEWFYENTPGLYESAVEVRLRDAPQDDEASDEINLKTIKYNILSTCLILELIGTAAKVLKKNFQKFLLRTLHHVLEKSGSSNLIIRTAGIFALEAISSAMGCSEVSQLINENSDYLLFNIQKQLKRDHENDSIIDMMSVIFKFSKSSLTLYIKDIVETSTEQMTFNKFTKNTLAYLKMFRLYAFSIKQWEEDGEEVERVEVPMSWDEFYEQCLYELNKTPGEEAEGGKLEESSVDPPQDKEDQKETQEGDQEPLQDENQPEPPQEDPPQELPAYVELLNKILTSSLQFFASKNPTEVILTHEIFAESFPVLRNHENHFLPMVHQMWYPFTKQFQVKNLVVLQHSFRLLGVIAKFAKDFIHKSSTDVVIPVINKFLIDSKTNSNVSYTQEFKLQREILSGYGELAVNLDIQDRDLDKIVDILLKFESSSNEALSLASKKSLEALKSHNPGLINFKTKYR